MLIAAIVLLLGVGVASAIVRSGDDGSTDQTSGPGTSTSTSTSPTSTSPSTSTTAGATATTAAPSGAPSNAPPAATTTTTSTGGVSSGLATGGAGQVAMGPTTPNTGIESALAPGVGLLGAGVGLRALLGSRRRHR